MSCAGGRSRYSAASSRPAQSGGVERRFCLKRDIALLEELYLDLLNPG